MVSEAVFGFEAIDVRSHHPTETFELVHSGLVDLRASGCIEVGRAVIGGANCREIAIRRTEPTLEASRWI